MPSTSIKHSLKKCISCCGHLPASPDYFGSSRYTVDKLRPDCKMCVRWYARHTKRLKGIVNNTNYDGEPIPHLITHNAYILNLGFLRGDLACLAHHVVNHTRYDVKIAKEPNGRLSISVMNDSEMPLATTDRGVDMEQFIFEVGKALKARQIRLELTDVDLHRALKEIYFI